jgi:hypothetical protein
MLGLPPVLTLVLGTYNFGRELTAAEDRSHLITIPRPPEWSVEDGDHYDSEDSYSYDSGDESDEEEYAKEDAMADLQPSGPERGIMLSLPFLELHGIELLELVSLSLTIKCDRCKTTTDVQNIKNSSGDSSAIRSESCRKCANAMDIGNLLDHQRVCIRLPYYQGYRKDLLHANSIRAGYIDLDGCTVVDLLPSNFIPTCSECSTNYALPGIVSVRGESSVPTFCRECHHRMSEDSHAIAALTPFAHMVS